MHMKNTIYYIFGLMCVGGVISANGESFLKPTSFPTTFADVPFITKMQVLADGYDDYESVYDKDGHCISGCAYPGITLEQETAAIERNTRLANMVASQYANESGNNNYYTYGNAELYEDIIDSPVAPNPSPIITPPSDANPPSVTNPPVATTYNCAQHRSASQTQIPANPPIDTDIRITSDFGPRRAPTSGASSWHKGIDISAPIGTPVYATASGTVEYIRDQGNRGGGKYVVIKHGNTNFRTAYFHLSDNHILKVGDTVQAGCLIGLSGNTGASTGAHLHYAIYYTQPNKSFSFITDPIDPLWTTNRLNTNYRFKSQSVKSCLHTARNFCGNGTVPPDTLPGEIK